MTQPQKNTALACAIIAGLISLPMTWMTIRGARIQGGFGELFNSSFGNMTVDVTGLNGSVTLLFKTPIWFIVGIAIIASTLQLMQGSKTFFIPHAAEWTVAIIALVWIGLASCVALFSSQATPGIGCLLGLASAVIPLICLVNSES